MAGGTRGVANGKGDEQRRSLARMALRMAGTVTAALIIFGPLSSLVLWSVAEKWFWPHLFPQQVGLFYWGKVLQGDMLRALQDGFLIAILVTILTLLLTVPLAYVLARLPIPFKPFILMVFLLPQAFPQLPVFVNSTTMLYRVNLGGKFWGVVLIHIVGALVFAVWTMTAVFKSVPVTLEEAAINLGASRLKAFTSVALPLATPGIIASTLLVFLYSLDEFTGTLLVGSPFVLTLPVYMYRTSVGYELQVASISALLLMVPGIVLLVLLERYMKSEYLSMFGRI
jgi:putative spermidine/putrescine transport system permease protein